MTKRQKSRNGRPVQFAVRLDVRLRRELEEIAEAQERTMGQIVRLAIREFIERQRAIVTA